MIHLALSFSMLIKVSLYSTELNPKKKQIEGLQASSSRLFGGHPQFPYLLVSLEQILRRFCRGLCTLSLSSFANSGLNYTAVHIRLPECSYDVSCASVETP